LNIDNVATRFFAAIPQSNINQKNTKKRATKQTDIHATNAQNEVRHAYGLARPYIRIRAFRDGQL